MLHEFKPLTGSAISVPRFSSIQILLKPILALVLSLFTRAYIVRHQIQVRRLIGSPWMMPFGHGCFFSRYSTTTRLNEFRGQEIGRRVGSRDVWMGQKVQKDDFARWSIINDIYL